MASGARANRRGKELEDGVCRMLGEEYAEVGKKEFFDFRSDRKPIYARQCVIGEDIYGKNRTVDIILYHPKRWPDCLVIECKWQSSKGSVDHKYPFEVLSIKRNKFQTIIVLEGGGFGSKAGDWLKAQTGKNNLLHVMNLGEINRFQSQGRL